MKYDSERTKAIREGIVEASNSLLSTMSTSFGPKGLDKMIKKGKECIVTNDGATILKFFKENPVHSILSSVSETQDVNCGDGTTSVVLLTCALYSRLSKNDNDHVAKKVAALDIAKKIALEHIDSSKTATNDIISAALTTLNSKVANKNIKMAQIAINALDAHRSEDIKIVRKIGGNLDDIDYHNGILMKVNKGWVNNSLSGTVKAQVIQFGISAPKTNMDSKIEIKNYEQMEQFVKEEKEYLMKMISKIKSTGAEIIFVQKSLLRESVSTLALHLLKREGISVVDGIERSEVAYLCEKLGVRAVSDIELLDEPVEIKMSVTRDDQEDFTNLTDETKILEKFIEIETKNCCAISISGVDEIVVEEGVRCLNDVMGVVKSLQEEKYILPGGCAVETGIGCKLEKYQGEHKLIIDNIALGFFDMAHFLATNAGLYSIEIVNKLKLKLRENWNLGISMRKNGISDMINEDNIIQPVAVCKSAVILAIETVQMLLRCDDMLPVVEYRE